MIKDMSKMLANDDVSRFKQRFKEVVSNGKKSHFGTIVLYIQLTLKNSKHLDNLRHLDSLKHLNNSKHIENLKHIENSKHLDHSKELETSR